MVPYTTTHAKTSFTNYSACCDSTASTCTCASDYDDGWVSFPTTAYTASYAPSKVKEEKEIVIPKKEIVFDRVVKMRNTDGRPIKYSTWKPVRILCGRDNIGTRNFKKL